MVFQARIEIARQRGILLIDDLISLPYCMEESMGYEQAKDRIMKLLADLKPGVTQWTVHPSWHTLELETLTSCAREREIEYRLLLDEDISSLLKSEGIRRVSWKDIRDAQRKFL
ncbi:hypothetical protein SAMN05518855_1001615 [Paenibacillus sp. CF384]|nr:hypothetical protein SAMN05518855_1001615 [Paenibacillus sp. CF384]